MQHYSYKPSHYFIQMTLPGIVTILVGLFCITKIVSGNNKILFLILLGVCIYNIWNVFVSVSNPSEIHISDNELVFGAFSKQHSYSMQEIKAFAMRNMAGNTKIYMVINHGTIWKGRYWVRLSEFNDSEMLTDFFYDLDAKVNPDSLFTEARRQGRERLKK